NQTILKELMRVGFSLYPQVQTFLFFVFWCLYLLTLAGNLTIMGLTWVDRSLHIPMCLFLSALSFFETCYTLTIIPKVLKDLQTENRSISVTGCGLKMYFLLGLGGTNRIILTLMGYDRFLAIHNPLRYPLLMTNAACGRPVASAWAGGFSISLVETALIFRVSFRLPNLVRHFFCHMQAVVRLSCMDSELTEFIVTAILLGTFLLSILTYVFILSSILRMSSSEGKQKAFSTCASLLTVVIIHFGSASIVYQKPGASQRVDALIAVPYTIIITTFLPIIFGLRNKDIKNAFRKIMRKITALKK
uniref:Olfactory receptor 10X1 n=1 Tax=Jaculus jaculus TaxID=51337 RepID=A0A8C5JXM2_JACJA